MKRAQRLRRPEHFYRVRREGRTWESALMLLNAAPSRRRVTRCGFVVGKRIGGAVQRNRAKRRMREIIRLLFPALAPGWDLVFVIRSPAVMTLPFLELRASVELLIHRAGLWREQPAHLPD